LAGFFYIVNVQIGTEKDTPNFGETPPVQSKRWDFRNGLIGPKKDTPRRKKIKKIFFEKKIPKIFLDLEKKISKKYFLKKK